MVVARLDSLVASHRVGPVSLDHSDQFDQDQSFVWKLDPSSVTAEEHWTEEGRRLDVWTMRSLEDGLLSLGSQRLRTTVGSLVRWPSVDVGSGPARSRWIGTRDSSSHARNRDDDPLRNRITNSTSGLFSPSVRSSPPFASYRISRTLLAPLEPSLSLTSTATARGTSLRWQLFRRSFADSDPAHSFIEYPSRADADEAIRTLSNSQLKGVAVTVEDAAVRLTSYLILLRLAP